jgi:hypothetical protein
MFLCPIPLKTRFVRSPESRTVKQRTPPAPDARHFRQGRCEDSCVGRVSGDPRATAHRLSRRVRSKFLRICHIRNVEELTPFRQRDPRISHARIIFALLRIVSFLCQRCAPGGRFPCGLTFGPHPVVSNLGPPDRCSQSCLHPTSRRAHRAPARRSDALRSPDGTA